jgi:hypothetical protein
MSVIRTCCNKELVTSCIHGCDNRYCTNNDNVTYSPLDMSCSGYVNKTVYSVLLREEVLRRDAEESSNTY